MFYLFPLVLSLVIGQGSNTEAGDWSVVAESRVIGRFSPFPEVAESVQEELDRYRAQEDEVKRLKSIMVTLHLLYYNIYTVYIFCIILSILCLLTLCLCVRV